MHACCLTTKKKETGDPQTSLLARCIPLRESQTESDSHPTASHTETHVDRERDRRIVWI